MFRKIVPFAAAAVCLAGAWRAHGACCYFSAIGSDVTQPDQKVFLTWDPGNEIETWVVQPTFTGSAADFGMVIPTPTRPSLSEAPRDFFRLLGVYTILKPTPVDKYPGGGFGGGGLGGGFGGGGFGGGGGGRPPESTVRVAEAGVVGALDYKIVTAEQPADLFQWLKENRYSYAGDEATLQHYITKKWFFTVMRIDPKQMRRKANGKYTGEVTPTRFMFASRSLVYPLRITQISVPDQTEALFYVQAPTKMDLPGAFSYRYSWTPMLRQALKVAAPAKVTREERAWLHAIEGQDLNQGGPPPGAGSRLEWARRLTGPDMGLLDGTVRFDRRAELATVGKLVLLRGYLQQGHWVTKFRRVFRRDEMTDDLHFVPAFAGEVPDETEYVHRLPSSPP